MKSQNPSLLTLHAFTASLSIVLIHVDPWVAADEARTIADSAAHVRSQFDRLDGDQDEKLTVKEFINLNDDHKVLRRDFQIYDFNQDQFLTRLEFSAVVGLTEDWLRGRIPDPFDQLLEDAVAALDESYEHWNERPEEYVNAHTFVANFIGSISPQGKRYVTGRILRQADRDGDGKLNRAEARRFMQYQLGIRWHDGAKLRERTGRLVRLDQFLEADQDQSNTISFVEFEANSWGTGAANSFLSTDRDGNGRVTYLEYSHYRAPESFFDPVSWFRNADKDLDARLSQQELEVRLEPHQLHMLSSAVVAFDIDGDHLLNLQEFRLSMLGNVNYPWHRKPLDKNRDGALSYDEFVFHDVDLFQLQRRYYFHRLDLNHDGTLSPDEFGFKTEKPNAIYLKHRDGGVSQLVYQDKRYPELNHPSISADGRKLLFERREYLGAKQSHIVLSDLRGENLVEICSGSHPSWASDGSRFTCARDTDAGTQVWIMSEDGRSGRPIAAGTSPKWSPDGLKIAFLHDNGVRLYDVSSGHVSVVIERKQHRFMDLGSDIAWAPSSDQLAMLANRRNGSELVVVRLEQPGAKSDRKKHEDIENTERSRQRGVLSAEKSAFAIQKTLPGRGSGQLAWFPEGILLNLPENDVASGSEEIGRDTITRKPGPQEGARKAARFYLYDESLQSPDGTFSPWGNKDLAFSWKSACVVAGAKWYIAISDK